MIQKNVRYIVNQRVNYINTVSAMKVTSAGIKYWM
jgi:hypothetical protein